MLYLPLILGTARLGRYSEKVAGFVFEILSSRPEVKTEIIDVRDFRVPATDNSETSETAKRWEAIVLKADGWIIVSPEYNSSYPGELKMMLDLLYTQYAKKPVGICGVSDGPLGGARMVEKLRVLMVRLGMVPTASVVYFKMVKELFDEQNKIKDQSYKKHLDKLIDELIWYAMALKKARETKI